MASTVSPLPGLSASRPGWFASACAGRCLAAAWVALLLLRLLLLGRGTLVDYDEQRYQQSFAAVQAAARADWRACAYSLSMVDARPLDALWRCVPAAGQLFLARYAGWDCYAYPSLLLPTLLNWLATVLAAWFFLRICQRLLAAVAAGWQWALVAAVLYASLVNTSIYVRHVLPYDGAMAFLLGLLCWVLHQPAPPSGWFWAKLGVGAGVLWLFYPGYYAGPVLLLAPLLDWQRPFKWALAHWAHLLALGAGFIAPLLAAEKLSRLGSAPHFWAVSYDLSMHILQGDPAEGYTFWLKYLWQVEGLLGMLLLAGLLAALGQAGQHLRRAGWGAMLPSTPRQKVLVAALLLFLGHATAAAVGHRIVWYGRLLHLYMPFLVLAGVAALATSRQVARAAGAGAVACLVGVISYLLFFIAYQRLTYPADLIVRYKLNCLSETKLRYSEAVRIADNLRFRPQGPRMPAPTQCPATSNDADSLTILVNFALLYPLIPETRLPEPVADPAARVIFDGPYYRNFSAYEFEGLAPNERAEMRRRQFRLQVWRIAAQPGSMHHALSRP